MCMAKLLRETFVFRFLGVMFLCVYCRQNDVVTLSAAFRDKQSIELLCVHCITVNVCLRSTNPYDQQDTYVTSDRSKLSKYSHLFILFRFLPTDPSYRWI